MRRLTVNQDQAGSIPALSAKPKWAYTRLRLKELYWDIREFPYKLNRAWQLVRVYWSTIDGDWSSIAVVLSHQISRVRKHIQQHDVIQDADRVCRQMLIAEHCLERLQEEPYFDIADKRFPERGKRWADYIHELQKQDMCILLRQLRYLRHWWD